MTWFKLLISLTFVFSLMCNPHELAKAADPTPGISPQLPLHPDGSVVASQASIPLPSTLNLPYLKAVLIVGGIDGDYGSWTTAEVNNMKLAEAVLRQNGVEVAAFYPPNNDWNQIKAAAEGAHFLFYRGHGVEWNSNPLVVGGFALSNGNNGYVIISSDDIRNQIHLAKNAIVMLYGCHTAGSSGGEVDLASSEAQNRVYQYADPFFDIGAGGYYANWYGDSFEKIVKYLFSGQTLGQAYQSYPDFNATTVERYTLPGHGEMDFWLDKDYYQGGWKYDYAFAGLSNATIQGLFGTRMVSTPMLVNYLNVNTSGAKQRGVTVSSQGSLPFTWSASLTGGSGWAKLTSTSGSNGGSVTITLNPNGLATGTYQATMTISTSTPGVTPNSQNIPIKLIVVNQLYQTFLPITQ